MATVKEYQLKNGSTLWEYFVSNGRNKGTGKPQKIHKRGFKTKTEAEQAAKVIEASIIEGTYLKVNPKKMTLSSFLKIWIDEYKTTVKEGTRIVYRETIRMYIDPYVGNYQLQDYSRAVHQNFINSLLTKKGLGKSEKGLSSSTIKVVNATLSNAFKKAIQLGYVKENPALLADIPSKKTKKIDLKYYTAEQVDKFIEVAEQEQEPFWKLLFLTIFDLGLRKSEAMALRWSDLDFKNKTISISKIRLYRAETKDSIVLDDTKTISSERTLILTSRLTRCFIEQYNLFYSTNNVFPITTTNNDFIFIFSTGSSRGLPVRSRSVNGAFDRIIRKAHLPKIKVHDGRHTFAVRMRQAGVPLEDIKDLMGHKDMSMTLVYAHISPEVKNRAIEKFEKFIDIQQRR